MALDQIERQWSIINTLCRRGKTTVARLAREYHVCTRTIRRDLDKLSRIFPIAEHQEGRTKYWSLIDGFNRVPPITFSPPELYALEEGTRLLRALGDPFLRPTLENVGRKIRATLDPDRLARLQNLRRVLGVTPRGAKDYRGRREILGNLFTAAAQQRRVRIAYQGLKDQAPRKRKVDPYRLWYSDGAVYLIGLCHLRNRIRVFAVDRISLLDLTDEYFLLPQDFDFDEYVRHAFRVMIEEPVTVKVRFDPPLARYVEERTWHPSQKTRRLKDGSLLFEATVGGTLEIKRWVLSFGAQAEALEPPELVQEIRQELERMRAWYAPHGKEKSRGAG